MLPATAQVMLSSSFIACAVVRTAERLFAFSVDDAFVPPRCIQTLMPGRLFVPPLAT